MLTATGTEGFSLEDFMANPPARMEWVDGKLVGIAGMTLKHLIIPKNQALTCHARDAVATQLAVREFSVSDELLA
ncbi:hypothetical protein [Kamptonema formosum]|uniref:hypothetical protein n=1 Tax=Kamptonema formosum TaxID=331992 RepID=UPI0003498B25|nr:hypothetical protein [Oscillatoria sp. PCC 10802]